MDVMLQRHCAKYIYVVPDGLRELMSDISREVLRTQPEHVYTFIADYLDALMITRENARVAARLIESITEIGVTIADLLVRTGMSREEADKVATIIQVAFRKHLAAKAVQATQVSELVEEVNIITEIIDEAGITPEQAEQAACIIQNAYRNFKRRQEREKDLLKGMVDWRVAARSTMRLYRKTGVTYHEANRAATLIKAAYKGYYTRRMMKLLLERSEQVSLEEYGSMGDEDSTKPISHWATCFADVVPDVDFYQDLEEFAGQPKAFEETSETIALGVVDSILKHVIPSSVTSIQSGFTTEVTGPLPSEVGSDVQIEVAEGEQLAITTESAPETAEAPIEGAEPAEASPTETAPAEDPTIESSPAEAPPAEAREETSAAPPAETPVEQETTANEAATDTTGFTTDTSEAPATETEETA